MIKRVIAVAVVFTGLWAAPASAQQYPPAVNEVTVSETCVPPGGALTVTASTFAPGTAVIMTLGPATLGTTTADDGGVATLEATVPDDVPAGEADVIASGGEMILTAAVTVDADDCASAPAPAPGASGGESAGGDLPRTGSDVGDLVRSGLALAAAGGVILAVATRRRRRAARTA